MKLMDFKNNVTKVSEDTFKTFQNNINIGKADINPQFNELIRDNTTNNIIFKDNTNLDNFYIWVNTHLLNFELIIITALKGNKLITHTVIAGSNPTKFTFNPTTMGVQIQTSGYARGQLYYVQQQNKQD